MSHDLIRRYHRLITRLGGKLAHAQAVQDSAAAACLTDQIDAARAALADLEGDIGTIGMADALQGRREPKRLPRA